MRQIPVRISPLAGICCLVIQRWIEVVRKGRGGQIDADGVPWTRMPAEELRQQLEREHGIVKSVRSIRRALQELVLAGCLQRRQRYAHRWRREWWYAPPLREPVSETESTQEPAALAVVSQADRVGQELPCEQLPAEREVLESHDDHSPAALDGAPDAKTKGRPASRLDGGKGFGQRPGSLADRLQQAVERAKAKGNAPRRPSSGISSPDEPLESSQAASRLLASASGSSAAPSGVGAGGSAPLTNQDRERRVGSDGRLYTRIGSHWVVDDVQTAPVR